MDLLLFETLAATCGTWLLLFSSFYAILVMGAISKGAKTKQRLLCELDLLGICMIALGPFV